jgi:hypothetical protein
MKKCEDPVPRVCLEGIRGVTHVFFRGQHLYFYFEVDYPVRADGEQGKPRTEGAIRLLAKSGFLFLSGKSEGV